MSLILSPMSLYPRNSSPWMRSVPWMRHHMLRPWSLECLVAHLMGQEAPSCLLFWLILWEAWELGRAPRALEEGASMSRRSSPPSWAVQTATLQRNC